LTLDSNERTGESRGTNPACRGRSCEGRLLCAASGERVSHKFMSLPGAGGGKSGFDIPDSVACLTAEERGRRETIFLLERMGVRRIRSGAGTTGSRTMMWEAGRGEERKSRRKPHGGERRRRVRRISGGKPRGIFERATSRRGRASRVIRSVAWRLARALRNAGHHSRAVMPGCVQDGCMGRGGMKTSRTSNRHIGPQGRVLPRPASPAAARVLCNRGRNWPWRRCHHKA